MVSVIGCLKCLFEPPRTVTKSTPCTIPSLSAWTLVTLARGQSFLGGLCSGEELGRPSARCGSCFVTFHEVAVLEGTLPSIATRKHRQGVGRVSIVWDRFSALNFPAGGFRCCGLWVSNFAGVKTSSASGLLETGTSGPGIDDSWYLSHQDC